MRWPILRRKLSHPVRHLRKVRSLLDQSLRHNPTQAKSKMYKLPQGEKPNAFKDAVGASRLQHRMVENLLKELRGHEKFKTLESRESMLVQSFELFECVKECVEDLARERKEDLEALQNKHEEEIKRLTIQNERLQVMLDATEADLKHSFNRRVEMAREMRKRVKCEDA